MSLSANSSRRSRIEKSLLAQHPIQRGLVVERGNVPRLAVLPEANCVGAVGSLQPVTLRLRTSLLAAGFHQCLEHLFTALGRYYRVLLAMNDPNPLLA